MPLVINKAQLIKGVRKVLTLESALDKRAKLIQNHRPHQHCHVCSVESLSYIAPHLYSCAITARVFKPQKEASILVFTALVRGNVFIAPMLRIIFDLGKKKLLNRCEIINA